MGDFGKERWKLGNLPTLKLRRIDYMYALVYDVSRLDFGIVILSMMLLQLFRWYSAMFRYAVALLPCQAPPC